MNLPKNPNTIYILLSHQRVWLFCKDNTSEKLVSVKKENIFKISYGPQKITTQFACIVICSKMMDTVILKC